MIIQHLIDQIDDLNIRVTGSSIDESERKDYESKTEEELIEVREGLVRVLYYE